LLRDPRIDAVKGDNVELRQVGAGLELRKTVVEEADVPRAGGMGERLRPGDLRRVEVGGVEIDVGIGGGEQAGGITLTAAEFAVGGAVGEASVGALGERAKGLNVRRQLAVKAVGIA